MGKINCLFLKGQHDQVKKEILTQSIIEKSEIVVEEKVIVEEKPFIEDKPLEIDKIIEPPVKKVKPPKAKTVENSKVIQLELF